MTDEVDITPILVLFEHHARLLSEVTNSFDLDPAIVKLAQWILKEKGWLTKEDILILGEVGGIMFRKQLQRRAYPLSATPQELEIA